VSALVLAGATLVLPDRLQDPGTVVVEDGRIVEVRAGVPHGTFASFQGHYIVPGFIDVHVHGLAGTDTLGGTGAVRALAAALPRSGVTAFAPTAVACTPHALRVLLDEIREVRATPDPASARVLPAHLESGFINPAYCGAQPPHCLRQPREALSRLGEVDAPAVTDAFGGEALLREIARGAPDVGIVTLAPELDGGLDLVAWLVARGIRVSLGHSGATFEQAMAAVGAGARQATHLFNRMAPLGHREPGLAGAVLHGEELAAEIIADGVHVHPALVRAVVAAKGPSRVLAITDATAAAGLPPGTRAALGSQTIVAAESAAHLADGTLAGSTATMDRVLRTLVGPSGLSIVDAALLCATTPARELGLVGHGVLAAGAVADLVVLDGALAVVQTYVGGRLAWSRGR